MKSKSTLKLSKVSRKIHAGFALFLVLTLIEASYRQGIMVSFNAQASVDPPVAAIPQNEGPVQTQARTFTGGAISIIDGSTNNVASPYPATIAVTGVAPTATVSGLVIHINGFTHAAPDDVDMMLVAPNGTSKLIFWTDSGGLSAIGPINVTIDDAAAASLPDSTAFGTGSFKPTSNGGVDNFPAPSPCNGTCTAPTDYAAPAGTSTIASSFVTPGTVVAAGTWSLYIRDDTGGGTNGSITSWSLDISFASPTLARMSSSSASIDDKGQVALTWQTGLEVDNLGFNVYREEAGTRTRVNQQLIAGSAFVTGPGASLMTGRTYRWRDNLAKGSPPADYWIEAIDVNGSSALHGPIRATYTPGSSETGAPAPTLTDLGRNRVGTKLGVHDNLAIEAGAPGSNAFKLDVKQTGFHRLTQRDLLAAGLNADINPRKLQLFEDDNERPIIVQGEQDGRFDVGDAIEFYATAPDNAYTDTHVYRLVAGAQKGLRIRTVPGAESPPSAATSFFFTAELKERLLYFSNLRNGERENFFGALVAREPVTRALQLQNVAGSAPSPATLEIVLQGVSKTSHRVKVIFNEMEVGVVAFDDQSSGIARFAVPQANLKEGDNLLRLVAQGGDSDVSLVDTIRVHYWHSYTADNDALQFTATAGEAVTISGFTNAAIRVLDISEAEKGELKEVAGVVKSEGDHHSLTVSLPGTGMRTLLAFTSDQVKSPAAIRADRVSTWRQKANKADLLIFTRRDFMAALDPLKALRQSQGYRVAVVDIEDVYDEFSFGNKTPQAIKDFLAYATSTWKVKPRFAILAGDASWDTKNYLGAGDRDIIPTKLIDTQFMETASDDWFADFNADGLAELSIGRLPARSVEELTVIVGKLVSYEQASPSEEVLLIADANDDNFNFERASESLRSLIPDGVNALTINRGTLDEALTRGQLLEAISHGQKVINYLGHGNVDVLRGNLLTAADISSLNNTRLSLFVAMTCLTGYFEDASIDSLAEAMVKAPHGGAVAAWASTGISEPGEQVLMNREFYRLLFSTSMTVGEAALKAKSAITDKDLQRTWVLLGDPAMRLK